MNFSKAIGPVVASVAVSLCACQTLEPDDPRSAIPGLHQYYNEALRFSLRYPGILNLKVEDRAVAGDPEIVLRLEYPGNEYAVLELATHAPGWVKQLKKAMVPESERAKSVGGQEGIAYDVKNPMDEVGLQTQIVVKRYGRNYVFTGKGKTFDEVIKSFEFIDPVLEGAEQDSSS